MNSEWLNEYIGRGKVKKRTCTNETGRFPYPNVTWKGRGKTVRFSHTPMYTHHEMRPKRENKAGRWLSFKSVCKKNPDVTWEGARFRRRSRRRDRIYCSWKGHRVVSVTYTCLLLTLTWSVRGGILGVASQSFLLCAFVPSFIAFPFAFTKRKNSFILINRQLKTKQKNYVFINCHGNNFFFKKITLVRPNFFHLPLDIIKLNNLPKSQKYYHPQFYIQ